MPVLHFFPLHELGACARRQAGELVASSGTQQRGSVVYQFATPAAASEAMRHFSFHFRLFPFFATAQGTQVTCYWGFRQGDPARLF